MGKLGKRGAGEPDRPDFGEGVKGGVEGRRDGDRAGSSLRRLKHSHVHVHTRTRARTHTHIPFFQVDALFLIDIGLSFVTMHESDGVLTKVHAPQ